MKKSAIFSLFLIVLALATAACKEDIKTGGQRINNPKDSLFETIEKFKGIREDVKKRVFLASKIDSLLGEITTTPTKYYSNFFTYEEDMSLLSDDLGRFGLKNLPNQKIILESYKYFVGTKPSEDFRRLIRLYKEKRFAPPTEIPQRFERDVIKEIDRTSAIEDLGGRIYQLQILYDIAVEYRFVPAKNMVLFNVSKEVAAEIKDTTFSSGLSKLRKLMFLYNEMKDFHLSNEREEIFLAIKKMNLSVEQRQELERNPELFKKISAQKRGDENLITFLKFKN